MFLAVVLASFLAMQADLLDRGRAALESGDFVKAEQLFREYIKQDPKSAEAYSNLATVYSRRGELQQAVELYEKALKANPALAPVHFNIAVQLGKLRRFDDAAGHLREFLKSYPNEPRAHQLLGLCLVETGEVRAALSELEASYKANPNDGSIRYALAYANARAGDVDRAAELFRDADSNQAQSKFIQGLIEYRQQNFDKAKVLLESVLALRPNADEIKAKLKAIDESILTTNEMSVDVNPAKNWEPTKLSVFEGKPFRVQVEGSYRFVINTAVDAAGFPVADPKTDMVGDIPCGALMGIVIKNDGKPGRPFAIGTGKDITPKDTGLLLLRINSPVENKHTGKISVTFSGFVKAG